MIQPAGGRLFIGGAKRFANQGVEGLTAAEPLLLPAFGEPEGYNFFGFSHGTSLLDSPVAPPEHGGSRRAERTKL